MTVQKLMTRHPITVAPGDTVADAFGLMLRHDIHELPVLDGERLVGILTRRDLQIAIGPASRRLDPDELSEAELAGEVGALRTEDVQTISEHESAATAARLLVSLRVGALPVVDLRGRLCGILSVSDLLSAAAPLFERADGHR